jgi:gluconokinase
MNEPAPKISVIILIGVSASGKSTVAEALAKRIGFAEEDGDDYHPPANITKMHAGIPLTDDDRWPWLYSIADAIDHHADEGKPVVFACSALKRAYRDILVHGRRDVRLVYLKGSRDLIAARFSKRHGHFMSAELIKSQFDTLEEPQPDENVVTVDIKDTVDEIVNEIVEKLNLTTAQKA